MMEWKQWAEDKLNHALNEPKWLTQARKESLQQFLQLGVPGRKQELWKYSNVKRLDADIIVSSDGDAGTQSEDQSVLVIDSGSYQFHPSPTADVQVTSYSDVNDLPEQQGVSDANRSFALLNQAVMSQGLLISVNASSEARLKVIYKQSQADWNVFRLVFDVAENAGLQLQEIYTSDVKINQVSQFQMSSHSRLKLQSQRALANTSILLNHSQFFCQKSVGIEQMIQNNKGHFVHEIIDVHFAQTESTYRASVANVAADNSQLCENIHVFHDVPNCKSRIIERSLADDKSQVTVNAKAVVAVAADGSDISQSLKNVLLSEDARINSKPELEINTDEVVAAHGSTIGELDETALNYLRSRGIGRKQARKMLIESFLQDANLFQLENYLDALNYE